MGKIISIGWDVGGWHGRKNALSVIVFENGSLKLTVPPKCIKRDLLFDNGEGLPTFILNEIAPNDRLVIAIDSPFGFPEAFSRLIKDVNYVFNDVGDDFYKNLYAFRKTDINIIDKLGKKPISPSFDKLTNNVSLTINLLRILRENNFAIAPWDVIDQKDEKVAIEVYPGVFKCEKERELRILETMIKKVEIDNKGSQSFLGDLVSYYYRNVAEDKSDEADSFICSLLGMSFLLRGELGFPVLQELPANLDNETKKEGWIFYPKDLEKGADEQNL